jgi:hypothetical protein
VKKHGSGKKRRWPRPSRPARGARPSLPERQVFFCDCGAMWGSAEALSEHRRECETVIAHGGHFDRDDYLMATEAILKRMDPGMDLKAFLLAVAVSQVSRERGVPQPDGSSRFEADDEEMTAKLVEVGSWYGLSEREVLTL